MIKPFEVSLKHVKYIHHIASYVLQKQDYNKRMTS